MMFTSRVAGSHVMVACSQTSCEGFFMQGFDVKYLNLRTGVPTLAIFYGYDEV